MTTDPIAQLQIQAATVRCSGVWTVRGIEALEPTLDALAWPAAPQVILEAAGISALDTSGAWLLHRTVRMLQQRGKTVNLQGLQAEFSHLLQLVEARAATAEHVAPIHQGGLESLGRLAWNQLRDLLSMLAFVGEVALVMLRSVRHPRRIRWLPLLRNLQTAGFEALPITGLLSFLMGVVIAYQGADQLQRFGANIYVADMVGFTMLRELSPMLTAIIVAGRSGSAYAAQIGTMKVTEETDALRTIGIVPYELLVLPKMLALMIALPLLTVYADVTGILGGMIMASSKLEVSYDVFLQRIGDAVNLSSFLTGIVKAPVFAVIIALVGCFQGFQVSGSADSVGRQTTMSVVHSIFLVIVADAAFSLVFNWLKI
jgi:phospholipid/cholesterol/gamma-HCH transport system permease protein